MNEFFPGVPRISYEGPSTQNPFAFRHYQPGEKVEGKTMHEHLRFAAAYWHVMRNPLSDPFGPGTALMPWDDGSNSVANAKQRVSVFFEFLEKTGIDFYCFHDRDVAPEMDSLAESNRALDEVVHMLAAEQERTGKKLLWGTACLFAHPRYAQGAATGQTTPLSLSFICKEGVKKTVSPG
jgi:xylose isomerase